MTEFNNGQLVGLLVAGKTRLMRVVSQGNELVTLQSAKLNAHVNVGDIVEGVITCIQPYGIFVDIGGTTGVVSKSEISWEELHDPMEQYRVGGTLLPL